MENELKRYRAFIQNLDANEETMRDLYLYGLAKGYIQGPPVGHPSIDKPWLKYYDEEKITTEMPQMTCYQYLYENNKNHLNNVALRYYGKPISFGELFENIDNAAKTLKAMGIKENDIITISLPNIPEAVYLFYACSKLGVIANMVDPRTSEHGIKDYIEEVDSKLVIIVDSYFNKVKSLLEEGTINKVVAVSPANSLPIAMNLAYRANEFIEQLKQPDKKINFSSSVFDYKTFIHFGEDYNGIVEANYIPNREFVIEHTGGTTGLPKGVVLTNENINAVVLQSRLTGIDMKREHMWLDIMPTFIAYGVGMGLHLPLTTGMETILIPKFDANKMDELILKHKANHIIGVPSHWGSVISSKKMKNKDLSFIIAPTVGGDAMLTSLEEDVNQFLEEHNCDWQVVKGYGMTEQTGGVAGTLRENNQIGSVGVPFVKTVISIFNPETNEELGYGEEQKGEICITGPNTMLRYFANEEATKSIMRVHEDGRVWIHSGDIGYMNEDGSIFVVGRVKNMIIRHDGFKVFPSAIEEAIVTHEAVETCAVVGIKDEGHVQGKLPKAFIVLKPEYQENADLILNEIKRICESKLQEYAVPYEYEIRTELPYTSVGKIDRLSLTNEGEKAKMIIK